MSRTIPKSLRILVWNTYIGEGRGTWKCLCGTTISQQTFECGHVIAASKKGETNLENLRPICSTCNKSMGAKNYYDFVVQMGLDPDAIFPKRNCSVSSVPKNMDVKEDDIKEQAKRYGIKDLRELIEKLDNGEIIDLEYYRKDIQDEKMKDMDNDIKEQAKKYGIKANLSHEKLHELIDKLKNGETIDLEYYRKDVRDEKMKDTDIKEQAKQYGIKANLSHDKIRELIDKLKNGETIEMEYYRKDIQDEKTKDTDNDIKEQAKQYGIKANLSHDKIRELIDKLKKGETIDPDFYRKDIREEKIKDIVEISPEKTKESKSLLHVLDVFGYFH